MNTTKTTARDAVKLYRVVTTLNSRKRPFSSQYQTEVYTDWIEAVTEAELRASLAKLASGLSVHDHEVLECDPVTRQPVPGARVEHTNMFGGLSPTKVVSGLLAVVGAISFAAGNGFLATICGVLFVVVAFGIGAKKEEGR